MRFLVLLALVGFAAAQSGNSKTQGKYVFDLLKPALTSAEVLTLLSSKASYPMLSSIPQTNFQCSSKAQPGFYADMEAQCQVFHRCDQAGNQTDYICVNSTVFNQITLVCDSWFNVDCERSLDYEDFANSRLYTDQPLFDTPPADYVAPSQLILLQNQGVSQQATPAPAPKPRVPAAGGRNTPARVTPARVTPARIQTARIQTAGPVRASGRAVASGASANANQGSLQVSSMDEQSQGAAADGATADQ